MNQTGELKRIMSRGKAWNIQVGSDWFGYGFEEPAAKEGDTVEFQWEQKGNFRNVVKGSMSVVGQGVAAPAPAKANSYADRDTSIQYQSSRKDALAILPILLEQGAVSLPSKKDAKFDACMALLNEITNTFFLDIGNAVQHGVQVEGQVPNPENF